jgi:hypothetical protein
MANSLTLSFYTDRQWQDCNNSKMPSQLLNFHGVISEHEQPGTRELLLSAVVGADSPAYCVTGDALW